MRPPCPIGPYFNATITSAVCGGCFPTRQLSKDHVRPIVRAGADQWNNLGSLRAL